MGEILRDVICMLTGLLVYLLIGARCVLTGEDFDELWVDYINTP